MIDKRESENLIGSIRQKIEVLKKTEMPPQLQGAHNGLANGSLGYVNDLAERLGQADSPEEVGKVHKKLEELNRNVTSTQLLSNAVISTYNRTKDEKIDPKAVQATAFDSIRIAWNLATSFAFDDSKSMKEKMTGFAKACMQGVIGMCQGALKGFDEGKGFFDTVKKMVAGTFEHGIGGYNKSLATSLLDEKERGQQIIADLRDAHKKVAQELKDDPDNPMKKARKAIADKEAEYLDGLERDLNSSEGEKLSKTVGSLEILQLSNAGTSLQSTGLSFLHRLVLGDDKKLDPKLVEKLGKDTLNITRNINQILDDSSKSMPSKLWTMTKAYVSAAGDGITAFMKGFEGSNLKEKYVNAVEKGFSTFMEKFSTALGKKSDTEIEMLPMGAPKSTHKRIDIPQIGTTSTTTDKESTQTVKEEHHEMRNN